MLAWDQNLWALKMTCSCFLEEKYLEFHRFLSHGKPATVLLGTDM